MKLSVIIVNYNVRAYLEQCLRTVFRALEGVEGDVFVVDNLSTDGSVEMVREKFPLVKLIANKENVGFSRANNQAIRASDAEYVVLLNPDTVVGEDVFRNVTGFLDAHPKAGGLGVKMIDGTGHFLPESKRGLPTPAVAFYKIIGLTRLFPRSRVFGRYHLGHLPENEAAPIEILSGACMFLRRKTLDEVGLLDESFFMYGEDIDLSYRITLGGYENWYYPEARIIHYKGESTKKSSVNYVFVFYNAMAIFARKHFTRRGPDLFAWVIRASIYLSAAGAIVARFLQRALLPMLDALALLLVDVLLRWGSDASLFERMPGSNGAMTAAVLMLVSFGLMGAYDLPVRLINVLKAAAVAVPLTVVMGSLFHAPFQMMIVSNALLTGLALAVIGWWVRLLLHVMRVRPFTLRTLDEKRVLAVGSPEEGRHALALLWQTHFGLGRQVQLGAERARAEDVIAAMREHDIDEVVFCSKDLPWSRIIELMERLRRSRATFKIAQSGREFIIGPSSIESLQDLLIMERHAVHSAEGRRTKRITDVAVSLVLLALAPLVLVLARDRSALIENWWAVVTGRKTWVGYAGGLRTPRLPFVKEGITDPVRILGLRPSAVVVDRVNIAYAKNYQAWDDLRLLWRGLIERKLK